MAAICENGHPLEPSASRCECGARMRMQWMGESPEQAAATTQALEQSEARRRTRTAVSLWPLLAGGLVASLLGWAIVPEAGAAGLVLVVLANVPLTIWVIPVCVELGIRSSWRHE